MTNWTPGPWEAFTEKEFSGWWAIRQSKANGEDEKQEVGSGDGGFEKHDAHLIAQAPAMYEALTELVSWFGPDKAEGYPPGLQVAIDVLAAARGESHG